MASYKVIHQYVIKYFKNNQESIHYDFPKKWEKYGDCVLFDKRLLDDFWVNQHLDFWKGLCTVLNCSRIALKDVIINDGFRTPQVKLLIGNDPWINHVDNKVKYVWNIHKNMFSAGNAPERHRIAKLDCSDQIVVDLFAGIGYFSLPYLVHAKAKFLHACEWNPAAVMALKKALLLNKVADRCTVYEGDNRMLCPAGVADRVNLGLIPSSEPAWETACRALKLTGGILTVHGNVETMKPYVKCPQCPEVLVPMADFQWKHINWLNWAAHVLHSIKTLMETIHLLEYETSVVFVHFVKSYAPHVDHVVIDVNVKVSAVMGGCSIPRGSSLVFLDAWNLDTNGVEQGSSKHWSFGKIPWIGSRLVRNQTIFVANVNF